MNSSRNNNGKMRWTWHKFRDQSVASNCNQYRGQSTTAVHNPVGTIRQHRFRSADTCSVSFCGGGGCGASTREPLSSRPAQSLDHPKSPGHDQDWEHRTNTNNTEPTVPWTKTYTPIIHLWRTTRHVRRRGVLQIGMRTTVLTSAFGVLLS